MSHLLGRIFASVHSRTRKGATTKEESACCIIEGHAPWIDIGRFPYSFHSAMSFCIWWQWYGHSFDSHGTNWKTKRQIQPICFEPPTTRSQYTQCKPLQFISHSFKWLCKSELKVDFSSNEKGKVKFRPFAFSVSVIDVLLSYLFNGTHSSQFVCFLG